MELVYRLLGLAALINEQTSRFRINFIPINWGIMVGIGAIAVFLITLTVEGFDNWHDPVPVPLADLLARRGTHHAYVMVRGRLHEDKVIVFTSDDVKESADYVPLTEPEGRQGLLVRVDKEAHGVYKDGSDFVVVGMLRSISEGHTGALEKDGHAISGVQVDHTRELDAGEHPASPIAAGLGALLVLAALVIMLASIALRYVIFRRTGEALEVAEGTMQDAPRATGRFVLLEQNAARRFLNVPAMPVVAEGGQLLLVSHVDASSTFFGVRTNNLAGYWAIAMQPGTLELTPGRFYLGLKAYPALRVRFHNLDGGVEAAELAFATPADRAILTRWLLQTPEERAATQAALGAPPTPPSGPVAEAGTV